MAGAIVRRICLPPGERSNDCFGTDTGSSLLVLSGLRAFAASKGGKVLGVHVLCRQAPLQWHRSDDSSLQEECFHKYSNAAMERTLSSGCKIGTSLRVMCHIPVTKIVMVIVDVHALRTLHTSSLERGTDPWGEARRSRDALTLVDVVLSALRYTA